MPVNTYTVLLPYVKIEDPHLCTDAHALLAIRQLLFPGLLHHNGESAHGILAENWQQMDAGRTWRFYLKKNMYFEDGHEMTSEDVVYSLKRAAAPNIAGQLFTVTYNEYFGGAEIYAEDRYTLVLKNPKPIADLEDLLSGLAILPAGWKSYADGTGLGFYKLAEYDTQSVQLELKSNLSSMKHLPHTLLFRAEKEPEARASAVRSGEVDLALDPPIKEIEALQHSSATEIIGWDSSLSVIFFIDCKEQPLNDVRVRQALNLAIDKDRIINKIVHGHAKPLNGPFSDRHFAFDPALQPYPYQPDTARELLKQAGVADGFELEVHAPTSIPDEGPALAKELTESFRKIGIRATLRLHEDRSEYARRISQKELHGLFCFDSSPLSSYKVLHEKLDSRFAGTWWQGYHNTEVNELISSATATCNAEDRQKLYRRAYRILNQEAPWVFLYQPRRFWVAHSSSALTQEHFDDLGFFKF